MSVIAAKVYENSIMIAADSIIMKDDLKKTNFLKLRHYVYNEIVCGGCGSAEELSLFFEYMSKLQKQINVNTQTILDLLYDFSKYKEHYVGNSEIENCYLIIMNGQLFEIDGFFVQKIEDYTAIGEGEPYALTALYLGQTPIEAVKTTCELCCHVSLPVVHTVVSL